KRAKIEFQEHFARELVDVRPKLAFLRFHILETAGGDRARIHRREDHLVFFKYAFEGAECERLTPTRENAISCGDAAGDGDAEFTARQILLDQHEISGLPVYVCNDLRQVLKAGDNVNVERCTAGNRLYDERAGIAVKCQLTAAIGRRVRTT